MATNLLIVYTSDFGNTEQMAKQALKGAQSVEEVQTVLQRAEDTSLEDTQQADGILIGSPMKHRNMHSRIKDFVERTFEQGWLTDDFVGKVGGVLTVGGGYGNTGAGCEIAQISIMATYAANGMIMVPFPKCTPGSDEAGMRWGPSGRSGDVKMNPIDLTEQMLEAAYHHGANLARVTKVVAEHRDLFATGNVAPPPEVAKMFQNVDSDQ